jgi:6-phosphogluconate dehydrogenase (decarboxylating)
MKLKMIGLGRMGANMVLRLERRGHEVVVYDVDPTRVTAVAPNAAAPVPWILSAMRQGFGGHHEKLRG